MRRAPRVALESVLDYFADDASLKLTIPVDTPLGGEFRGKEQIIEDTSALVEAFRSPAE